MKKLTISGLLILAIAMFTLSGCGGSGGGENNAASTPTPTPVDETIVSGTVAAGLVANGTVKAHAINSDGSRRLLTTTTTDSKGKYSANIGNYKGPVLVEASGSYTDEATGQVKTITPEAPLRAAHSNVAGTSSMAVTPLTELAVVKAGSTLLTEASIVAANRLISEVFKVDIITTQPVAPNTSALQATTVTQEQKDYTIALAAISQMAVGTSGASVKDIVNDLRDSITDNGMSSTAAASFQNCLVTFLTNTSVNNTGIHSVADTNLRNVGGRIAVYKLSTGGGTASALIYGIQLTVTLSDNATVRTAANGAVSDLSFHLSGVAPQTAINEAKYTPAVPGAPATVTLALGNAAGFSSGEFATLTIDVAAGSSAPAASALTISSFKASDADGAAIPGLSPAMTASP